jgi:malonyl CoA-acyl carrier protein transacylase
VALISVIEPKNKEIFAINISKKRNISIVKRFLSYVVNKYGLHSVSLSDGVVLAIHNHTDF